MKRHKKGNASFHPSLVLHIFGNVLDQGSVELVGIIPRITGWDSENVYAPTNLVLSAFRKKEELQERNDTYNSDMASIRIDDIEEFPLFKGLLINYQTTPRTL